MYTILPSTPTSPPSYRRGLGFIGVTLPLMMSAAWVYGDVKHTLLFHALTMGLIPLSVSGWPLAIALKRRRYAKRYHPLFVFGLAVAGPIGYFAVLISSDILGNEYFERMVFGIGDAVFLSRFNMKVGSWMTLWLEAGIAWTVMLVAIIFYLRLWELARETTDNSDDSWDEALV